MDAVKRTSKSWHKTPLFCVTPLASFIFLGGSALLVGLLFLFRGALLAGLVSVLIQDSPIRRTDVLLLLGGDVSVPQQAA